MLGDNKIVGFVPTSDYARAREFFEGKLGLGFISQDDFALVLDANGIMLRVTKVRDHTPAPFTILGWEVREIEKMVARLTKAGVTFERYDLPGMTTVGGITEVPGNYPSKGGAGERAVWFRDSEGNLMGIGQAVR